MVGSGVGVLGDQAEAEGHRMIRKSREQADQLVNKSVEHEMTFIDNVAKALGSSVFCMIGSLGLLIAWYCLQSKADTQMALLINVYALGLLVHFLWPGRMNGLLCDVFKWDFDKLLERAGASEKERAEAAKRRATKWTEWPWAFLA